MKADRGSRPAIWTAYLAGILALFGACVHAAATPVRSGLKMDAALQRALAARPAVGAGPELTVIVRPRRACSRSEAEALARSAGGQCVGMLGVIDSFCAALPPSGVLALAERPEVEAISLDALVHASSDVVTGLKNKIQSSVANVVPAGVLAKQHRKMAEPGTAK